MIPNFIVQKTVDVIASMIVRVLNPKRKVVRIFGIKDGVLLMCVDIEEQLFMGLSGDGRLVRKNFSELTDTEHRIVDGLINFTAKSRIYGTTIHVVYDTGEIEAYKPKYIGLS